MNKCDHDFVEETGFDGSKETTRIACSKCGLPEEAYKVGYGKRLKQ